MSWEIQPEQPQAWEERKVLVIGDQIIDVSDKSAEEVKQLIIEKAREKGWSRVDVLIDGEPVSPGEFDKKFESAKVIEVVKADVAG